MSRFLSAALMLLVLSSAAHAEGCEDLTALQVWVGYLSWMGALKALGYVALAVGFVAFFWGLIKRIWESLWEVIRSVADIIAYALSIGLVVIGSFVPEAFQIYPVFIGCILFGASVYFSIWLREIEDEKTSGIFALLMLVYGAVAIFYSSSEVGFLSVGAFVGMLGFSVAVTPFCYSFGFRRDEDIAAGTAASLVALFAYVGAHLYFPHAPDAVKVFEPGAFWLGSFVGYLGLLILSNRWYIEYQSKSSYAWMQLVTVMLLLLGIASGMILGINPLSGIAFTFFMFFLAAKVIEIGPNELMAVGAKLLIIGALFTGVYFLGQQHQDLVKTYITTSLPH